MKPSNTLTLRRKGRFTITTSGDNHCGVEHPQAIEYYFTMRCSPNVDSRGFLIDQLNVDAFFQKQRHTELSCEDLVMGYSKDLYALINQENPGILVYSTVLELIASPFKASMEYECHWDEELEAPKRVVRRAASRLFDQEPF